MSGRRIGSSFKGSFIERDVNLPQSRVSFLPPQMQPICLSSILDQKPRIVRKLLLAAIAPFALSAAAQAPNPTPALAFEVASVKQNKTEGNSLPARRMRHSSSLEST
jgi:hypothetical protein